MLANEVEKTPSRTTPEGREYNDVADLLDTLKAVPGVEIESLREISEEYDKLSA
jgi:hypothetical protein